MLYFFILGGVFLTTVLLVMGMHRIVFASRLSVMQRLETVTSDAPLTDQPGGGEQLRARDFKRKLLNIIGTLGAIILQQTKRQAIQQKLVQAHILMRAEELIGLSLVIAVVVFLAFYLISGLILVALPMGLLAYFLPSFLVGKKKKNRMHAITNQLPEALDIISSGLRAGYSFPQAMSVVSREMQPPIKDEFYRVIWENRMGKTLEEALYNLGERTDSEDLDLFITALLIQKQVGGNLAEVLNNISHTIRERVRIKGEIRTLTAQGKLSALIVILLPIAVAGFMMILDPDYIMLLLEEILGLIMIGVAIVFMIIGSIIISKIVDIDV